MIDKYKIDDNHIQWENDVYEIVRYEGPVMESKCQCDARYGVEDFAWLVKNNSGDTFYFIVPMCSYCGMEYEPKIDENVE